ncbi:hypothetical protein [Paraburkholderia caledonica]|uniref:Uncharacterized protein n=1 Tax=Paraburkholderia caledonica TaxID=134536 RepID=A0ABU1KSH3_9BURK|nr:hypothetical protein [Paraburkholderia caledonica]MDR6373915.1 hypothetical protein [Paraburkholderia caledonica]
MIFISPGTTTADLVAIVGTVADLAAQGQADAELDSKCMNYALTLGPDQIKEFEELMGTDDVQATQH